MRSLSRLALLGVVAEVLVLVPMQASAQLSVRYDATLGTLPTAQGLLFPSTQRTLCHRPCR